MSAQVASPRAITDWLVTTISRSRLRAAGAAPAATPGSSSRSAARLMKGRSSLSVPSRSRNTAGRGAVSPPVRSGRRASRPRPAAAVPARPCPCILGRAVGQHAGAARHQSRKDILREIEPAVPGLPERPQRLAPHRVKRGVDEIGETGVRADVDRPGSPSRRLPRPLRSGRSPADDRSGARAQ